MRVRPLHGSTGRSPRVMYRSRGGPGNQSRRGEARPPPSAIMRCVEPSSESGRPARATPRASARRPPPRRRRVRGQRPPARHRGRAGAAGPATRSARVGRDVVRRRGSRASAPATVAGERRRGRSARGCGCIPRRGPARTPATASSIQTRRRRPAARPRHVDAETRSRLRAVVRDRLARSVGGHAAPARSGGSGTAPGGARSFGLAIDALELPPTSEAGELRRRIQALLAANVPGGMLDLSVLDARDAWATEAEEVLRRHSEELGRRSALVALFARASGRDRRLRGVAKRPRRRSTARASALSSRSSSSRSCGSTSPPPASPGRRDGSSRPATR